MFTTLRGLTYRQALAARPEAFWAMLVVWPFAFCFTLQGAWMSGAFWLGMILYGLILLYFAWKHENKPIRPWPPFRNPTEPPTRPITG